MRVAVTGATGHLGSFLVRRLLESNASVAAIVRPESDFRRIEDVLSRITVIRNDDLKAFAPEVVFHLAWSGITRETRDDASQIHQNVPYALEVFRAAQSAGMRCWIGLGSQAEYGPTGEVLRENLPLRPSSAYGVAKIAVANLTETLCRLAGIRYVWLRLLATYGPADDERHLIPMLIRKLQASERPALSKGEQLVDYLYVGDAADALVTAASDERVSGTYNLASGDAIRVRELAEIVRDVVNPAGVLGLGEVDVNATDLHADVSRFRNDASWSPRTPLRTGIAATAEWYLNHGVTR